MCQKLLFLTIFDFEGQQMLGQQIFVGQVKIINLPRSSKILKKFGGLSNIFLGWSVQNDQLAKIWRDLQNTIFGQTFF